MHTKRRHRTSSAAIKKHKKLRNIQNAMRCQQQQQQTECCFCIASTRQRHPQQKSIYSKISHENCNEKWKRSLCVDTLFVGDWTTDVCDVRTCAHLNVYNISTSLSNFFFVFFGCADTRKNSRPNELHSNENRFQRRLPQNMQSSVGSVKTYSFYAGMILPVTL